MTGKQWQALLGFGVILIGIEIFSPTIAFTLAAMFIFLVIYSHYQNLGSITSFLGATGKGT